MLLHPENNISLESLQKSVNLLKSQEQCAILRVVQRDLELRNKDKRRLKKLKRQVTRHEIVRQSIRITGANNLCSRCLVSLDLRSSGNKTESYANRLLAFLQNHASELLKFEQQSQGQQSQKNQNQISVENKAPENEETSDLDILSSSRLDINDDSDGSATPVQSANEDEGFGHETETLTNSYQSLGSLNNNNNKNTVRTNKQKFQNRTKKLSSICRSPTKQIQFGSNYTLKSLCRPKTLARQSYKCDVCNFHICGSCIDNHKSFANRVRRSGGGFEKLYKFIG